MITKFTHPLREKLPKWQLFSSCLLKHLCYPLLSVMGNG